MILLEDTRQQEKKHSKKHKYFLENGIHWNRSTLICGDYQIAGNGSVAVDTKFSIQELIGDIQFKAMSKKDVKLAIDKIWAELDLIQGGWSAIYHIITDDDDERFVEKEISEYCWKNKIEGNIIIQKMMEKKGNVNVCTKYNYIPYPANYELYKAKMKEYNEAHKNEFSISYETTTVEAELQNLYVKRHGFFHRGLVRAKNYGVKLHILVDNEDGVADINSLFSWVNPRRKILVNSSEQIGWYKNGKPRYRKVPKFPNCMMGEQLAKACLTMQLRYGCEFHFCKPSEAGAEVIRLLTHS